MEKDYLQNESVISNLILILTLMAVIFLIYEKYNKIMNSKIHLFWSFIYILFLIFLNSQSLIHFKNFDFKAVSFKAVSFEIVNLNDSFFINLSVVFISLLIHFLINRFDGLIFHLLIFIISVIFQSILIGFLSIGFSFRLFLFQIVFSTILCFTNFFIYHFHNNFNDTELISKRESILLKKIKLLKKSLKLKDEFISLNRLKLDLLSKVRSSRFKLDGIDLLKHDYKLDIDFGDEGKSCDENCGRLRLSFKKKLKSTDDHIRSENHRFLECRKSLNKRLKRALNKLKNK